jgi:hypothetical protein
MARKPTNNIVTGVWLFEAKKKMREDSSVPPDTKYFPLDCIRADPTMRYKLKEVAKCLGRSGDRELAGGAVLQSSGWRSRVEGGGDTAT